MLLTSLQIFTQGRPHGLTFQLCAPKTNLLVVLLKSLLQQLLAPLQASCDRESKRRAARVKRTHLIVT